MPNGILRDWAVWERNGLRMNHLSGWYAAPFMREGLRNNKHVPCG